MATRLPGGGEDAAVWVSVSRVALAVVAPLLLILNMQLPKPVSEATPAVPPARKGTPLTCHVLCPPGGTWPGRPPGGRSMLAPGWTRSACSARRCDTAGR